MPVNLFKTAHTNKWAFYLWERNNFFKIICLHFLASAFPQGNCLRVNHMTFKFLRKGTDKGTRLSTTNEYKNGDLKMIYLKSMILITLYD